MQVKPPGDRNLSQKARVRCPGRPGAEIHYRRPVSKRQVPACVLDRRLQNKALFRARCHRQAVMPISRPACAPQQDEASGSYLTRGHRKTTWKTKAVSVTTFTVLMSIIVAVHPLTFRSVILTRIDKKLLIPGPCVQ